MATLLNTLQDLIPFCEQTILLCDSSQNYTLGVVHQCKIQTGLIFHDLIANREFMFTNYFLTQQHYHVRLATNMETDQIYQQVVDKIASLTLFEQAL
jgi:hypothetical protein